MDGLITTFLMHNLISWPSLRGPSSPRPPIHGPYLAGFSKSTFLTSTHLCVDPRCVDHSLTWTLPLHGPSILLMGTLLTWSLLSVDFLQVRLFMGPSSLQGPCAICSNSFHNSTKLNPSVSRRLWAQRVVIICSAYSLHVLGYRSAALHLLNPKLASVHPPTEHGK